MTLPFQTRLILFCTVTFALLLTVLSFASYRLLAQQLDLDASADLAELTDGLHGYVRIEDGVPSVAFDEKDADQAAFVHAATRYYQIYDGKDGRLARAVARVSNRSVCTSRQGKYGCSSTTPNRTTSRRRTAASEFRTA